jgi:hypothetical protein
MNECTNQHNGEPPFEEKKLFFQVRGFFARSLRTDCLNQSEFLLKGLELKRPQELITRNRSFPALSSPGFLAVAILEFVMGWTCADCNIKGDYNTSDTSKCGYGGKSLCFQASACVLCGVCGEKSRTPENQMTGAEYVHIEAGSYDPIEKEYADRRTTVSQGQGQVCKLCTQDMA